MLNAILAVGYDNVGVELPWHLPLDLKRFKQLTTGHAIIMGRVTHQSIGKPLPKRTNIVVTRQPALLVAKGCDVFSSPARALAYARAFDPEPFVIGGAQIYEQLWSEVRRVYLTEVHIKINFSSEPIVRFPFDREAFTETHRSDIYDHEGTSFTFVTLER